MYGICDRCGCTAYLDCYYKEETGEELYLCDSCGDYINESGLEMEYD